MSTKTSGRLQLMNKSTTTKTTKFNFQTIIQKPRNFNPSKFSTLTVLPLPINTQTYKMNMMRFQFTIVYIPGEELVITDAAS